MLRAVCRSLRERRKEVRAAVGFRPFSDQSDSNRDASEKLKALLISIVKEGSDLKAKPSSPLYKKVKQQAAKTKEKEPKLEDRLSEAAKDVVRHMKDPDINEAQLLDKILFKSEKRQPPGNTLLSDIVSDMKIEKEVKRSHKAARKAQHPRLGGDAINLLSGDGLGIFAPKRLPKEETDTTPLTVWNKCRDHQISLSVSHPPSNVWEQMIHWTEKGALWQLPLDNEQGLDEEKKTYFADHVFLEALLDGWCPDSGPVRHFMELVCVGLSRNHWLSVAEKKAHIQWYREYLCGKAALLSDLGAGQLNPTPPPHS